MHHLDAISRAGALCQAALADHADFMEQVSRREVSGFAGGAGCAFRRLNWNRNKFDSRPIHVYQPKSICLLTKFRNAAERSEWRAPGGREFSPPRRLASDTRTDVTFHAFP